MRKIINLLTILCISIVITYFDSTLVFAEENTHDSLDEIESEINDEENIPENVVSDEELQKYLDEQLKSMLEINSNKKNEEIIISNKGVALNRNKLSSSNTVDINNVTAGLPSQVDLSETKYFPPIRNANTAIMDSSIPFAITYYQFTYEANKLNGITVKDDSTVYSPSSVYNCINYGNPKKKTAEINSYGRLENYGAVKWSELPYDGIDYSSRCNNVNALKEALNTRLINYETYNIYTETQPIKDGSDVRLEKIKTLLYVGKVLEVRIAVTDDDVINDEMSNLTIGDTNTGEEAIIKSHFVDRTSGAVIVGYNDNIWVDVNKNGVCDVAEKGAFKVAGCYGENWYNQGYVWVLYDALNEVSQIPGNVTYSDRAAFARCEITSERANQFRYITVAHKDVNLIAQVEYTSSSTYYMSMGLTKRMWGEYIGTNGSANDMIPFTADNVKYRGVNIRDYSDFADEMEELVGECEWMVELKPKCTLEELKVTLLDNKNNVIGYKNVGTVNSATDKIIGFNTEFTLGDLDYDGDVSVLDVNLILKIVTGQFVPSNLQKKFADYNCDGRINNLDAQAALNYIITGTK